MNYDEYDDDDDYPYGHSMEDECISPTDAQQWIFDRARGQHSMSAFLANNKNIEEEDDDEVQSEQSPSESSKLQRRDSECYQLPELNEVDRARLMSCMDEIRNIVGESLSDQQLVKAIMKHNYDFNNALDELLNSTKNTPQQLEAVDKDVPEAAQEPIEKGIGNRLLEESGKLLGQLPPQLKPAAPVDEPPHPTILITPKAKNPNVTRGFEINSPRVQSPSVSGRNTPVQESADDTKLFQTPKPLPKELQRNAQELFKKERGGDKQHIHMVVIGHVDAGKSTLMGHLLCDTGNISQRVMHKNEQESKKLGKQSFMYAWVLDETGEERERGITMDVGSSRFETVNKQITHQ